MREITPLTALIMTIVIEYAVLLMLGERRRKVLLSSVVVNVLTNIPLNLYLLHVSHSLTTILVGELLVVLAETLWYYCFLKEWKRAFVYSILCNAVSFLSGLLIELLYIKFIH